MPNCSLCGKHLSVGEGHYSGGMLLCSTCGAGGSANEDKPCQRCGILLPPHELKMFNSRYYCNYCIMDLQDEDARHRREEGGAGGEGGEKYKGETHGICERCGRSADMLYSNAGRRLCAICLEEETGKPPPTPGDFFAKVGGFVYDKVAERLGAKRGEVSEKGGGAEKGGSGKGRGSGGTADVGGGAASGMRRGGFEERKMPAEKKHMDLTRGMLADRRRERGIEGAKEGEEAKAGGALEDEEHKGGGIRGIRKAKEAAGHEHEKFLHGTAAAKEGEEEAGKGEELPKHHGERRHEHFAEEERIISESEKRLRALLESRRKERETEERKSAEAREREEGRESGAGEPKSRGREAGEEAQGKYSGEEGEAAAEKPGHEKPSGGKGGGLAARAVRHAAPKEKAREKKGKPRN